MNILAEKECGRVKVVDKRYRGNRTKRVPLRGSQSRGRLGEFILAIGGSNRMDEGSLRASREKCGLV